MRKTLSAFAAVLLTAAAVPYIIYDYPIHAEEAPPEEAVPAEELPIETRPEDMFSYTLNTADRAEITRFTAADTYQGDLVIPDQLDGHDVGYINEAAFLNAKGVTSISIPATVTDMGNSVFMGCDNLERFIVREGNYYFSVTEDGVLLADDNQLLVAYPAGKAGDSYTIPGTVDEIASAAFSFSKNLKEVILPDSLVYIDEWSFAYSALEKINIPGHVIQIDDYAFAYCDNLHDVTLNSGLESIYDATFSCCPSLTQIALPDTLKYVGQNAFAGTGLTSITIPASVQEIDYCAFGYDRDLNPISSFVIYGMNGSTAQSYCTESDPYNDYQNHFTFIAVDNTDTPPEAPPAEEVPQEIQPSEEDAPPVDSAVSDDASPTEEEAGSLSADADSSQIPAPGNAETTLTDVIGPEVKDNAFLQILLATVGGIAVILAISLIILSVKKPTKQEEDDK